MTDFRPSDLGNHPVAPIVNTSVQKLLKTLAAAACLAAALTLATAEAHSVSTMLTVSTSEYTLGDTAFHVPGFHPFDPVTGAPDPNRMADIELTGVVHYPSGRGPFPMVILAHGLFDTCADRQAGNTWEDAFRKMGTTTDPAEQERLQAILDEAIVKLNRWPCAPGIAPLPSYRGYDYLGRRLAEQGFVVVSISANGVNVGELGEPQDMARAALVNQHLRLWQQLSTGTGPLVAKFGDRFKGKVDLTRVGTMGHSRGGRGMMRQAADIHRAEWPAGVKIKAVVPLAPAGYFSPDGAPHPDYQVTDIPFAVVAGTCDLTASPMYFTNTKAVNRAPIHLWTVRGANHNFFNVQWSPSSGQVMAHDDARDRSHNTIPPGQCVNVRTEVLEPQLSESAQREFAVGYLSAFFRRHLRAETRFDPMLNGITHPLAHVATVDVETDLP
ncbi:dienelactone hydrolase [Kibdelosporangium banguiense]|uniref:Dienelactone hydrolase n=1 Tax=Kibdelosporangium banguiense TaxID=1365924 RepID=A0ABS4TQG5_9PSEU|nr:hypothetical protein [Kibdelosporangium banguiense]MBP2326655.1 dienelactone hydrolase [Kibdelosporangium banguiense]